MTKTLDEALLDWVHFQSANNQHQLMLAAKGASGHPLALEVAEYVNLGGRDGADLYGKTLKRFGIEPVIPD